MVDEDTKRELSGLPEKEIEDRFYRDLEFGTGGLRGIMGAGTNRINVYTVRKATQGLALDILAGGEDAARRGVVIAYDSRKNSAAFARECASVLSANGVKSYLFEGLRPTPELSFAVRYLGCAAGVVITASHNPKEYNGYKVYGEDGGQVPPLQAARIQGYIDSVDIFEDVRICEAPDTVMIGEDVDLAYIRAVLAESLGEAIPDDFRVVYTPLYGAGNIPVRRILSEIGVKNVTVVAEQELPDPEFPTVKSPNPENREAFDLAIERAKEIGADIILGTDPDSDRIGVVVRERDGGFTVLNGNQMGALLCEYILRKTAARGLPPRPRIVKTIVTTEMVRRIADAFGVETVDVLTGFKNIGDKIKEYEVSGESFLFGLEESYGYLKGTYARDKDAIVAAMLISELASECKREGITLTERLGKLYERYGYFGERLLSYTFQGIEGLGKIRSIMSAVRALPAFETEIERIDYSNGIDGFPPSDVMKFIFSDGWLAARPSGTEPKIKFYIAATAPTAAGCDEKLAALEQRIKALVDAATSPSSGR